MNAQTQVAGIYTRLCKETEKTVMDKAVKMLDEKLGGEPLLVD